MLHNPKSRPRIFGSFLSFRLPPDLDQRLRHICSTTDQSISAYVRQCVVEHLSQRISQRTEGVR